MKTGNDAEILQEFASANSEAAFQALVERHLPLVYSAALRQVAEPVLATLGLDFERVIGDSRQLDLYS